MNDVDDTLVRDGNSLSELNLLCQKLPKARFYLLLIYLIEVLVLVDVVIGAIAAGITLW